MKKTGFILISVLLIFSTVFLIGCSTEKASEPSEVTRLELSTDSDCYPVYHSLDSEGQRIYGVLYDAMEQHNDNEITIGVYKTESELKDAVDWINKNYRLIAYELPDFFWVNPYKINLKEIKSVGEYRLNALLSYTLSKEEYISARNRYNTEVERIVSEAKSFPYLFDRVLYVHDEILSGTEYDEALPEDDSRALELSAYGALVSGKTVCSGYTLAFTSIMQKLNIECGAEFDTPDNFSVIGGHVWNYCRLEDDYYYFDLTWDDTGFDSEAYKPYMDYGHCYFAVSADELSNSNFTMQDDAPTPDCNGTKYNYFVYNNMSFSDYDYDKVKASIEQQKDNKYIALRFDSYGGLIEAEADLMEEKKIYDILTDIDSLTYVTAKSGLHLYIFPK